jgi:ElaB/YqjD/DUF883 family membrane-anchored ribosome-binding protein
MIEDSLADGLRNGAKMFDNGALGDAPAQVKAKADELVLKIQDAFATARLRADIKRGEVDAFVETKPYTALVIAAFAGLVVGHMISGGRPKVVYLKDARRWGPARD